KLPTSTAANTLYTAATYDDTRPAVKRLDDLTVQTSATDLIAGHSFEVEVAFPRSELASSVQRQPWQSTDTPPELPTALGVAESVPSGDDGSSSPTYSPPSTPLGGLLSSVLGPLCGCIFLPLMLFGSFLLRVYSGFGRRGFGPRRPYGPYAG